MKKTIFAIVSALVINNLAHGQEIEFTPPVKMGVAINSKYDESNPILSEDGKTLYFVRAGAEENSGGQEAGQDVWMSRLENGQWTDATNSLAEINNGDNNAVVGTSQNGNKLFLINSYSAHPRRDRGVVFTARTGDQWIAPKELELVLKMKSDFYGFYMSPDEEVLLISMKSNGSVGQEDLYVSLRNADSTWSDPLHLGETINSEGFEISPFLSDDKKTLYFSSNGLGGHGSADIFKSTRLDDSWTNWSQPENLGSTINSPKFDAYFSVYPDKAFFSSNREGDHTDIYALGIEVVENEPEPVAEEIQEPSEDDEEVTEIAEATPATVMEEEEKEAKTEMTYTVYFSFDESQLNEENKDILKKALTDLDEEVEIRITGYTDNQGPEDYNLELSQKRAKAVSDFLQEKGLPAGLMITEGKGEEDPVATNDVLELRKKNRRVEIRVLR